MKAENPRAVIFGVRSTELSKAEREFIQRTNPLGFILFARNCKTPEQIQKLTQDLREAVGRHDAPILIDQEGGRTTRLPMGEWRKPPPGAIFGLIAEDDIELAVQSVKDNAWLIGQDLKDLGINVVCAPIVDVPIPDAHDVIGDRAFSENGAIVSALALGAIEGFEDAGITPIIKHLPGHGRAMEDSHKETPVVFTDEKELDETDFSAFRNVCHHVGGGKFSYPWGMTAHIVFDAIDSQNPASASEKIVSGVIRGNIDFKGFLISDCITMEALEGSFAARAKNCIAAGCDAVLHCNGNLEEMIDVAANVPHLSDEAMMRLKNSYPLQRRLSSYTIEMRQTVESRLNEALYRYWGDLTN